MCGICGIVELDGIRRFTEEDLQVMAGAIRHRGPDDEGTVVSGPVGLGFRRLSIIDLPGGHQPMTNEDGTIWIVFNGEIYNHRQLRPILEGRGHRYANNSDTETILHLYEEYGPDCVRHLRGMFAFAIWDSRRKRLFCARDRLGIKPFYYVVVDGRFLFASEIKALLELPQVHRRLNRLALPEFLCFGYLSSDATLFEGIHKLMPGHHLQINLDGQMPQPVITQYWDLEIEEHNPSLGESDYVSQFREMFAETVKLHLMSDVPVGVFLSGGLDSSSIAAEMARARKDRIQTFSVGYAETPYSELPYAQMMARHINSEHHEVTIGPEEFFASLPSLIWHEDEPIVWPSSVSLYFVARCASEKVKVVLTGEGGDEIFAGYLKYRLTMWNLRGGPVYRWLVPQRVQELIRKGLTHQALPDSLARKLRHSFLYYPDIFQEIYFDNFYSVFPQKHQPAILAPGLAEELRGIDAYANCMCFFNGKRPNQPLLDRLLYLDIKTYLVELLMKQDQMSMATSIESRVPFLDHELATFTARVPARYKVRNFSGKYLLRRAMADRLPARLLQRTKKGFPTPIRPWLRSQLADRVASILTDGRTTERRLINPGFIRQLLEAHRRGSSYATEGCWRLLNLELWSRIFLDRDYLQLRSRTSLHPAVLAS
jgi:asparagine synthase (glutamine-hydrolysing)